MYNYERQASGNTLAMEVIVKRVDGRKVELNIHGKLEITDRSTVGQIHEAERQFEFTVQEVVQKVRSALRDVDPVKYEDLEQPVQHREYDSMQAIAGALVWHSYIDLKFNMDVDGDDIKKAIPASWKSAF